MRQRQRGCAVGECGRDSSRFKSHADGTPRLTPPPAHAARTLYAPPADSWDRVPYYTTVLNGTKSLVPAYNEGFGNFIVAGGGANGGAFDNDDGSSL